MLLTVADLFIRCKVYTCQQELLHVYVNTMFGHEHWLPHAQQSTKPWYSENVLKFAKQAVSSHSCLLVQSSTVISSTVSPVTALPASLQQFVPETHQHVSLAAS